MSLTILILLALAGLFLILLDILVIPGGVVGFLGLALLIFADYQAFESLGSTGGYIFLGISIVALVVVIIQIFRPSFWKRVSQISDIEGKVNTEDLTRVKLGDQGKALTRLNPSGNGRFGDHVVEVTARNSFIDSGSEIEIVKIESNHIYVKTLNQS